MSGHNGTKLSQRLHACVQDIWPRYLSHPFVMQMADGTLPMEKFRYYMLQDYLPQGLREDLCGHHPEGR